jgi:organic radical activating enzyme
MPKIPLYNKGLGPSVDVATGQLGTSIDAQALSSPARQLASLGETIGQAGQNFAQNQINYNSRKARIDFEFQKAEQNREATKAANELSLEFERLADDFILNSSTSFTTTGAAASAFNESITAKAKSRIAGLGLTDRQKSLVETKVLNGLAPKLTNAKRNAYNHGTNESTRAHDARVENALTQITGSEDIDELAAISLDLQESANTLIANGGNPKVAPHQIGQVVLTSAKKGAIASATTLERLDEIETGIEGLMVSTSVKNSLRSELSTKKTALTKQINDGVIGDINSLPLEDITSQEFNDAIASVTDGDDVITLMFEVPGVDGTTFEAQRIDLTGADETMRQRVKAALISARNQKQTNEDEIRTDSVQKDAANMSLADLNTNLEDARRGIGIAAGAEGAVLDNIISSLEGELNRRKPQVLLQVEQNTRNIKATLAANFGETDEETSSLISSTADLLASVGEPERAEMMVDSLGSFRKAKTIFSGIEFASETEIIAAVNAQRKAVRVAEVGEAAKEQAVLDALTGFIEQRNDEMEVDPVGYLERRKGRLSVSERIRLQQSMGKADIDIRIASAAEVRQFRSDFASAENYTEKAQIGQEFIAKYGAANETFVLRNLTNQGVLTVVDNLIIANPENAFMFDVDAANDPGVVSELKTRVGKAGYDATIVAVKEKLSEYSNSILGGGFNDVLSRSATDVRARHVFAMSDIVTNTALYYQSVDNLSPQDAAEKATNAIINSQFSFTTAKGFQVRMPKGMEGIKGEVGQILEGSLNERHREYFKSVIDIPSKVGIEAAITDDQYINDLIKSGRWVTTTDNTGVYLVDQTGNMVVRKRDPQMPAQAQETFIVVPFSQLMSQVRELQEGVRGLGGFQGGEIARRKILSRRLF